MSGIDSYTKLMLHMDGADASTTFTDSSSSAHTMTVAGNAQIDTAQSKFGGSSGLFDGAGDYIYCQNSDDFIFGTGAFTVDFWFRPSSVAAGHKAIFDTRANDAGNGIAVSLNGAALNVLYTSSSCITGQTVIAINTWYHLALCCDGGASTRHLSLWLDGIAEGSCKYAFNMSNNDIVIGSYYSANNFYFAGHIEEFRVSKGIERWVPSITLPDQAYSTANDYNQYLIPHRERFRTTGISLGA